MYRHSQFAPVTISFENDITLKYFVEYFRRTATLNLFQSQCFPTFFFVETVLWKHEPEFPTCSEISVLPFGEAKVCFLCYFVVLLSILRD